MLKVLARSIRWTGVGVVAIATVACGSEPAAKDPTATSEAAAKPASAPASAPKGVDWTARVEKTAEGGFRIGNPNAEVKLVEFASLTCPHCADFHKSALEAIKRDYVAGGRVSYELRNFVLNPADYAATLLVRCQGATPYFALVDSLFKTQAQWLQPFAKFDQAAMTRLNALPPEQRIVAYADEGGLDELMKARGVSKARFQQCLNDKAASDELDALRRQAIDKYKLTGTPTFVLNDETQAGVYDWAALKPRLDAALN